MAGTAAPGRAPRDPTHPRRPAGPAVLAGAILAALLLGAPALLLANGGTLRLANVVMGDYRVSVFTDPTPVRPDSLDVSVLVLEEGIEGVPEGLEVVVRTELLEPAEGSAAASPAADRELSATREAADDPRYYAAKFALGQEGVWRIGVAVRGEGGEGEASFEVTARERGILGHPLVITLLALLPLGGAAWWVLRDESADAAGAGGRDDDGGSPAR